MKLTRRSLLQITGAGLLQWLIGPRLGLKYLEAIASPDERKLALLVGINNYGTGVPHLRGALMDVELQRELLIDRFGFQNADILALTEAEATKKAIIETFHEHLIKQARSGDKVIFHFSGYGSEVNSGPPESPLPVNTLVAADDRSHLLEDDILTLSRSLSTDKYTLILDTSHRNSSQPLQGHFQSRSLPIISSLNNLPEMALSTTMALTTKKTINGMVLKSAAADQIATEFIGSDWNAGLFTYCLTQYLWEVMPASRIIITLGEVSQRIGSLRGGQQKPQLITDAKSSPLTYYIMTEANSSGEAVVSEVIDKQTVEITLTGIPLEILEVYERFSLLELSDNPEITLQIISRQGFKAKGQLLTPYPVQIGQIWREKVRLLPQTIGLSIAFDSSLTRIERVDATSAIANLKSLVTMVNSEEDFADCVLTKIDNTGSYALMSAGGVLIPETVGLANEAVKSALKRLTPHLEKILAGKIWKLTLNGQSSGLQVGVNLEKEVPISEIFITKVTRKLSQKTCEELGENQYLAKNSKCLQNSYGFTLKGEKNISLGLSNDIQYKINNGEDVTLYSLIVIIDSAGKTSLIAAHDNNSNTLTPLTVSAGDTLTVNLKTPNVRGKVKSYAINSVTPFPKTMSWLNSNHIPSNQTQQIIGLDNPLTVAASVWQDLSTGKEIKSETGTSILTSAFELNQWATLGFIYQLVE